MKHKYLIHTLVSNLLRKIGLQVIHNKVVCEEHNWCTEALLL